MVASLTPSIIHRYGVKKLFEAYGDQGKWVILWVILWVIEDFTRDLMPFLIGFQWHIFTQIKESVIWLYRLQCSLRTSAQNLFTTLLKTHQDLILGNNKICKWDLPPIWRPVMVFIKLLITQSTICNLSIDSRYFNIDVHFWTVLHQY